MEERRLRAAELFAEGVRQAEIARQLGVTHQTVSDWHGLWKEGGRDALRGAGRAGRRPKLWPAQLAEVEAALAKGPQGERVPHRVVDADPGGRRDRAGCRGALPPWPRVADPA